MSNFTTKTVIYALAIMGMATICAAYPIGFTLEQSDTGYAELSNGQFISSATSVHMGTVTTSDKSAIVFEGGPQLSSINQLSYWTYVVNAGTFGQLAPWMAIYLDSDPGCTYDSWIADYIANSSDPTLFYIQAEPYYATGNPVLNTWQKQTGFGGTALTWVGLESPDYPHEAPTLADYISGAATNYPTTSHGNQAFASREYGSLYICAIKIRMGYGTPWVNTEAYVDDVSINGVIQSFELPVPSVSGIGLAALALALLLAALIVIRR